MTVTKERGPQSGLGRGWEGIGLGAGRNLRVALRASKGAWRTSWPQWELQGPQRALKESHRELERVLGVSGGF